MSHSSGADDLSVAGSWVAGPALVLPGGLRLATRAHGSPQHARAHILAAHGWMDNVASFDQLAPRLAELGAYVLCVDLPGHGHSAHLPPSSWYGNADYAAHLVEAWRATGWSSGVLLGHSLGAGLCSTAAAAIPGLRAVVLLEGLGPVPRALGDSVELFTRAIDAKAGALLAPRSIYASLAEAAAHRQATATRHPGSQHISEDAATRLVARALEPATAADVAAAHGAAAEAGGGGEPAMAADVYAARGAAAEAGGGGGGGGGDAGAAALASSGAGFCFRHDPRIKGPSPHYFSEEQAQVFLRAITAPVLLVLAVNGWPRPAALAEARARAVRDLEVHTLPGSHHLHADPDTAPAVADVVIAFLRKRGVL